MKSVVQVSSCMVPYNFWARVPLDGKIPVLSSERSVQLCNTYVQCFAGQALPKAEMIVKYQVPQELMRNALCIELNFNWCQKLDVKDSQLDPVQKLFSPILET